MASGGSDHDKPHHHGSGHSLDLGSSHGHGHSRSHEDQDDRQMSTSAEGIPLQVLQQAEQAAAGDSDRSKSESKHAGHDVPLESRYGTDDPHLEHLDPPPPYGHEYGTFHQDQNGLGTRAKIGDDGRVNIRINQTSRKLSDLLVPALRHQQEITDHEAALPQPYIPVSLGGTEHIAPPPPMNVVIHVVGSRGDVQPFVALGKVLKDTYGHRVRLATHPNFQEFVTENGLEFFSIGGDPAQLMAFMVKNPGLMPGFDTLRTGDVGKRRKEIGEMVQGCWRSCFETGDGLGPGVTAETTEDWMSGSEQSDADYLEKPFIADAIIANPPSFAHIHCAEKLGIPLHVMFTMPYSPTQAFPHPLANIQSSNADPHLSNYISYALVDTMTWQGLGDVINRFRAKSLGLEPISLMWAPGMLQRLRIPHTYCWSPALIPKPKDWGSFISISGFYFLNLASNYTPDPELQAFLDAGPPPVYIGFGSIVLDDPNAMTKLLFEAVAKTGQRALVSKGWGGMGADELGKPDNVYMLGNVPHDWLFKHVSCVVHHGGAGTTAAGITAGRPTLVVPFFGDQPFWGAMVARAGAGPEPIPHKQLTADNLAAGIRKCLEPQSQEKAHELAARIAKERGTDTGAQSFHQMLDVDHLRCTLCPNRVAVWRIKRTQVRLSALAATTLANEGLLSFSELKLYRPREYELDDGPWDPITGGATSIIGTMSQFMMGVADLPVETLKLLHIHPDASSKAGGSRSPSVGGRRASADHDRRTSTEVSRSSVDRASHTSSPSRVTSGASTPLSSQQGSAFNLEESLSKLNTATPRNHGEDSQAPHQRHSSMADALRGQLGQVMTERSRSSSRPADGEAHRDRAKESIYHTAMGTGKGVQKIVGAGMKSPMDFTMALAQGFHNAPKLYNDDTVRKAEQVTDFKSGLRAATKEFGFGMYDGITGLVTQPLRGAKKEGAAGFIKGFGKGIAGIALKPGAAIWGIPGYTMKGVYKELQKQMGSSVHNYIIAARTAQGYEDWNRSSAHQRQDIVERFNHVLKDLKKKKNPDELMMQWLSETTKKRQQWFEEHRNKLNVADKLKPRSRAATTNRYALKSEEAPMYHDSESTLLSMEARPGAQHANTFSPQSALHADPEELEKAIRVSVQETSRGSSEEDAAIERAIRASLAELQRSTQEAPLADEDEALRRAIAASAAEAQRNAHQDDLAKDDLERALTKSLEEHGMQHGGGSEFSTKPGAENEAYHGEATAASGLPEQATDPPVSIPSHPPPSYDSQHLAGTTRQDFERQQAANPGGKTREEIEEEEVVMRYVKKQSALEEQHRQTASKGKERQRDEDDENDEELQRALKISMEHTGQAGEASGS